MMPGSERRVQRVASLVRAELSRVLLEEVSDPSLKNLWITEVELSKDFKHARIFFSRMESQANEKDILRGFHRAAPYLKRKLGDNLELRYIPDLEFQADKHGAEVSRLNQLFEETRATNRSEE